MKLLTALCSLCFLLFNSLHAATPTVTVTLADFTADFSGAGYVVRITPTTGGTAARVLTDSDGVASFATVTPGIYALSIEGAGLPTLQIRVPNTSATTAASTIVISNWTPPGTGTITSGIWENEAGTIKPSAGQARNTLKFTSSAADAAANVGLLVDTTDVWDETGALLAAFNLAGTNRLTISTVGGIVSGEDTDALLTPTVDYALTRHLYITEGTSRQNLINLDISDADFNSEAGAYMSVEALSTNSVAAYQSVFSYDIDHSYEAILKASVAENQASLTLKGPGIVTLLKPTVASTGTAIAYTFNTSNQLTNGDTIVSFQNTNTVRFAVDHAGAVTAADAVTAGGLVTGTGFISASGYAAVGSTNRWKTGIISTGATVALTTTNYLNITVNGVSYKIGLVQ